MSSKAYVGDCLNCESTYNIQFDSEVVSEELPEHCPFCGEIIEDLSEDYIDDDVDFIGGDEEWE